MSPDANTEGSSSGPSDDKGADSSTAETDANQEAAEDESSTAGDKAETETTDESDAAEKTDESVETSDDTKTYDEHKEEAAVAIDKPEDTKLEFHKHPRFQELISEKNSARQENEMLKPQAARIAAIDSYLNQSGISAQEFAESLEVLRLLKSDPAAAYQKLRPTIDQLQMLTGERIPAELEAEVAAGTLSAERAKQLAQASAQAQRAQAQTQGYAQSVQQQAAMAVGTALNSWDMSKRGIDPDFKPKAALNDPTYATLPDGKWEICNAKLIAMQTANPPRSPQEAVAQVERAYTETQKLFASFVKPAKGQKNLSSTRSSTNSSAVIKTKEDVVAAIMAGKRPHQMKYA